MNIPVLNRIISLNEKVFHNDEILEDKYFIWFYLMVFKAIQVTTFPQLHLIDYLFAGVWIYHLLKSISQPREMLLWFLMAYFTNIMHWFTDMSILGGGGARILLLDVFMVLYALVLLFYFIEAKKFNKIFLGLTMLGLTAFWFLNMLKGFVTGGGGYVIGEARFYFASIFLLGIVNLFDKQPRYSFRKVLKIISLCSVNVIFFIIMQVLMGSVEGGEAGKRFNPGNGLAQLLVMGLLIAFLDFIYGSDQHIIKGKHFVKIGLYLAFIFISGVRGILVSVLIMMIYFLVFSSKVSLAHKIYSISALLALGIIALQFSPVQRVLNTQQEYVSIMMGEGGKNAKTTSDFRMQMWGVFWNKLTEDNTRMMFGRPFGMELVDISSFYWAKREKNTMVDNSLAHNDFLAISMTNGLIFTGIFLLVLISYVIKAFIKSRVVKEMSFSYLFLFLGWCLFFQILQSATNAEIKHFGWSICLWIHMGLIGALLNYLKTKRRKWKYQKSLLLPPPLIKEPI